MTEKQRHFLRNKGTLKKKKSLHIEARVTDLDTLWKFNGQGPRTGQKSQTTTMANIRFSNFLKTRVSEKTEDCLHPQRNSKPKSLILSSF